MLMRARSAALRMLRSSAMLRSFKLTDGLSCFSVKFCGGAVKGLSSVLQPFAALPDFSRRLGRGRQGCKRRFNFLQLVLTEILKAEHLVPCVLVGADQLV